jgi:uncharacterized membrane protein
MPVTHAIRSQQTRSRAEDKGGRMTIPGLLAGIGFGGLLDGIVLHEILQWHHMLSSEGCCPMTTVRGLELNTLADGFFHLASAAALFIGTVMIWRRARDGVLWSGWQLLGFGMQGWGLFNVVEGLIDHQLLGIHHVRGGPDQFLYDMAFLALGGVLFVMGLLIARRAGASLQQE